MKISRFKNATCSLRCSLAALLISLPVIVLAEKSDFSKAVDLVREKDFVQAFGIFERLAMNNDHDAQFNVAILLRKGIGRPANYPNALKWAWLAELGGVMRAAEVREEVLDLMPEDQLDLVRKQVKDVLQAQIDVGQSVFILQMADYYLNVEAEPDYKNAYAFRSLAAALGIEGSSDLRNEVEPELEPADLIEAQILAEKMFSSMDWIFEAKK